MRAVPSSAARTEQTGGGAPRDDPRARARASEHGGARQRTTKEETDRPSRRWPRERGRKHEKRTERREREEEEERAAKGPTHAAARARTLSRHNPARRRSRPPLTPSPRSPRVGAATRRVVRSQARRVVRSQARRVVRSQARRVVRSQARRVVRSQALSFLADLREAHGRQRERAAEERKVERAERDAQRIDAAERRRRLRRRRLVVGAEPDPERAAEQRQLVHVPQGVSSSSFTIRNKQLNRRDQTCHAWNVYHHTPLRKRYVHHHVCRVVWNFYVYIPKNAS